MEKKVLKISSWDRNLISKKVTEQFLSSVSQGIDQRAFGTIKTESGLAEQINYRRDALSKMKMAGNNFVTVDVIAKVVNDLNMDANLFFIFDEKSKPGKLIRDTITINSSGSGITNNTVKSSKTKFIQVGAVNGNNNIINNAEKIIQGLQPEVRAELNAAMAILQSQNTSNASRIDDLKKMNDQHVSEKAILQKKLDEINKKYITLLEKKASGKK